MPNFPDDDYEIIYNHVVNAVKQLRRTHKTPILLVEHAGNSNALTNITQFNAYEKTNKASRKAFETLIAEGVASIFYISHDELDFDPEAWVDYVHPSDIGMQQQAQVLEKKIREILY